jgi:hypothetical protein
MSHDFTRLGGTSIALSSCDLTHYVLSINLARAITNQDVLWLIFARCDNWSVQRMNLNEHSRTFSCSYAFRVRLCTLCGVTCKLVCSCYVLLFFNEEHHNSFMWNSRAPGVQRTERIYNVRLQLTSWRCKILCATNASIYRMILLHGPCHFGACHRTTTCRYGT